MSLSRYLNATAPDRYAILGVVLTPFSLGHFFTLSKYDSPFVSEKVISGITLDHLTDASLWEELIFALSVCRHESPDFDAIINNPPLFNQELRDLNKHITKVIKKERRKGTFNPLVKLSLFQEYLKEAFKVPHWTFPNSGAGSGRTSVKHWSEQLLEDLVTKGNRTRTEALNMHLADAWQSWAHIAADAGAIELLADEQAEQIEATEKTGDTNLKVDAEGWAKLIAHYEKK